MAGTAVVVSLTGETDAAAGFYIPLAPPLSQKIFPHSYKISYANYTRTVGFCSWQIFRFVFRSAHKIRLFCCRRKVSARCGTAPFQCQRSQRVCLTSVGTLTKLSSDSVCVEVTSTDTQPESKLLIIRKNNERHKNFFLKWYNTF